MTDPHAEDEETPKVTVDSVEEPIRLADETIEKLTESSPRPGVRRASDVAAAKAADDLTTVSTIQNVSSPHAQAEESLVAQSQRLVNLMWEKTQQLIAVSVVWAALTVAVWQALQGADTVQTAASVFLYGVANLVIGFYFGRTNHQKIGGVQQGR